MEFMALLLFAGIGGIVLWPLVATVRALVKRRGRVGKYLRLHYTVIALFILWLIPHLWMSYTLAPLKKEFDKIGRGGASGYYSTGEYVDGRAVNELDFGGQLSDVVERRSMVLFKHQYVPFGTGRWWCSQIGITKPMAYLYTFVPRSTYRWAFKKSVEVATGERLSDEDWREFEKKLKD